MGLGFPLMFTCTAFRHHHKVTLSSRCRSYSVFTTATSTRHPTPSFHTAFRTAFIPTPTSTPSGICRIMGAVEFRFLPDPSLHVGDSTTSAGVPRCLLECAGNLQVMQKCPVHLRRRVEGVPQRECLLGHITGRRPSAGVPGDLQ